MNNWIKKFKARDDITQASDGTWDCSGNVYLNNMNLTKLPLKFGKVIIK